MTSGAFDVRWPDDLWRHRISTFPPPSLQLSLHILVSEKWNRQRSNSASQLRAMGMFRWQMTHCTSGISIISKTQKTWSTLMSSWQSMCCQLQGKLVRVSTFTLTHSRDSFNLRETSERLSCWRVLAAAK